MAGRATLTTLPSKPYMKKAARMTGSRSMNPPLLMDQSKTRARQNPPSPGSGAQVGDHRVDGLVQRLWVVAGLGLHEQAMEGAHHLAGEQAGRTVGPDLTLDP